MDTDIAKFLNEQLAHKPAISIPYVREETKWRCKMRRMGGDWGDDCIDYPVKVQDARPGPATVAGARVEQVRDLAFHRERTVSLPVNARVRSDLFKNCSPSVTLQKGFSLTLSANRGWSVTKSRGINTTTAYTVNLSGDFKFIKTGATVNFSQQVSTSTQNTENFSATETRSVTESLSIPPHSAIEYRLIAYEETIEVPFSAKVIVDGPLAANLGGYTKASDLLTAAERTLPFEGHVRITDVSRSDTSVLHRNWQSSCEAGAEDAAEGVTREYSVPAATLATAPAAAGPARSRLLSTAAGGPGDSMGAPPDGKLFELLYSVEEMRMDFGKCGFNDLGLPNSALYRIDHGTWHEYLGGKEVRVYAGTKENFLRCYVP